MSKMYTLIPCEEMFTNWFSSYYANSGKYPVGSKFQRDRSPNGTLKTERTGHVSEYGHVHLGDLDRDNRRTSCHSLTRSVELPLEEGRGPEQSISNSVTSSTRVERTPLAQHRNFAYAGPPSCSCSTLPYLVSNVQRGTSDSVHFNEGPVATQEGFRYLFSFLRNFYY